MAWRMLCGLFSYYQPWASQLWLCASFLPSRRPTRTNLRVRNHREKRRQSPPTQAVLFQAQMLAAPLVSRLQCLRRFPPEPRGRKLKEKKCGSIATTVGWCSATTIGFIFGRTFSSGIESPLPKPTPRPSLEGRFSVQCDDCRKEYFYKPSEVLKYEQELSDSFTPHPLFRDC